MTEENECTKCQNSGFVEVLGDGDGFEADVVDVKPCPECNPKEE